MTPAEFTAARRHFGLSQTQLAEVMGYAAQPVISNIERGVFAAVPPLAARLMEAYMSDYRPPDWPDP